MAKKKEDEKTGKISVQDLINKKCGMNVAFSLKDENPSEVVDWISTGSTWLNSIVCRGRNAGTSW